RVIGCDLLEKPVRDQAECNAVIRLHDKLLLKPELLLEVLKLGEEINDLASDTPDDFDLGKVLLNAHGCVLHHVVKMHHFILDIEINFSAQKITKVLVDKV